MVDPLLRWREEFPILARTTYLVSHSLGAMPRAVAERLRAFAEQWATRGVRAWAEGWWDMPRAAGDRVGRIIGAPPGSVVMLPNVSTALGALFSGFERGSRRLVYSTLDFSTVQYVCDAQRARGADATPVPGRDDDPLAFDLERFLGAVGDGRKTALVVISAVLFKTSELVDLGAIVRRAHDAGALVCADLYQAAGTVPIDVTALGVDFAVGGSVKWLCGGPGAGYLYVRPELAPTLEPTLTGWAGHAAPFAFEAPPQRYADGAARFLNGTSAVPALVAAGPGHEIVTEIGVRAIRAKSQRQTERLIELCEARGFAVRSPRDPARRGGSVTADVPGGAAVVAELAKREILCDYRPGAGIRLSPHFYTTDAELEAAVGAIEEIVRSLPPGARSAAEGARY